MPRCTGDHVRGTSATNRRHPWGGTPDAMLARYIRDGELFADNAAGALL